VYFLLILNFQPHRKFINSLKEVSFDDPIEITDQSTDSLAPIPADISGTIIDLMSYSEDVSTSQAKPVFSAFQDVFILSDDEDVVMNKAESLSDRISNEPSTSTALNRPGNSATPVKDTDVNLEENKMEIDQEAVCEAKTETAKVESIEVLPKETVLQPEKQEEMILEQPVMNSVVPPKVLLSSVEPVTVENKPIDSNVKQQDNPPPITLFVPKDNVYLFNLLRQECEAVDNDNTKLVKVTLPRLLLLIKEYPESNEIKQLIKEGRELIKIDPNLVFLSLVPLQEHLESLIQAELDSLKANLITITGSESEYAVVGDRVDEVEKIFSFLLFA
jgi:hypothetical protein